MFFQQPQAAAYDNFYLDDDGDIFAAGGDDELAGIGSFFKKVGKVLLPIAAVGVNFIPGIGQLASAGIAMGISAGQSALDRTGGAGGAVKGKNAINDYGRQVNDALAALKNQVAENPDAVLQQPDAVLQQAEQLVAGLSDSARVNQPKKGNDKKALDAVKSAAAARLAELKTLVAQTQEKQRQEALQLQQAQQQAAQQQQLQLQQQQQTAASGQSDNSTFGGFDTKTLVLIACGFGAILALKG